MTTQLTLPSTSFRSDHKLKEYKEEETRIGECICGWKVRGSRDGVRLKFKEHKESFPLKEQKSSKKTNSSPKRSTKFDTFDDSLEDDLFKLFNLHDKEGIILDFLSLHVVSDKHLEDVKAHFDAKHRKLFKIFEELIAENIRKIIVTADTKRLVRNKIQLLLPFSKGSEKKCVTT